MLRFNVLFISQEVDAGQVINHDLMDDSFGEEDLLEDSQSKSPLRSLLP